MKALAKTCFLLVLLILQSCTKSEPLVPLDPNDSHSAEDYLTSPQRFANPKNDDEYFFNYRLEKFAPDTEPFIKETFGHDLMIEPEGFWEFDSYTSHAVGFSTNLPALSIIEYGETKAYGMQTVQQDSYYYQHLHYIKGLRSNTTYHFRLKVQDYDKNLIVSEDHTFTTLELTDDVIRIPDDMVGQPPYTLDKANTKYVLTKDMDAPTLGINIKAHNITIDLDGHTLTYDNTTPKVTGSWWNDYAYNEEASFGIRAGLWNFTNVKVYNGVIRQGKNGGMGFVGVGFNPLFLNHMGGDSYNEVAGITVDYYGDSVDGMVAGNGHIHHNVLYDRGSVIDDRHLAIRALSTGGSPDNDVSYNSLRRFRHRGIDGSGKTHHNELYSDSFDTNSFAVGLGNNAQATDNKIFGMGYNPLGIGWGNNTYVANNFIYIRGYAPTRRSNEYERNSAIAGMRVTNYDGSTYENMLYEHNTIVLKAEDGCTQARGVWTTNGMTDKNIIYRSNIIKVEAMPDNVVKKDETYYNGDVNNAVSAVTFSGDGWERPADGSDGIPAPIIFEDNRLIGNVNLLVIGEGYGITNSVWMYRTKLEKITHDSEYFHPVRLGFWYWNTFNNRMIDTEWATEISSADKIPHYFGDDQGYMEISYGQSRQLTFNQSNNPIRNANVAITLNGGRILNERTDNSGKITLDILTEQHLRNKGTTSNAIYSSYTFTLSGYAPFTISTAQLRNTTNISLTPR
jgi:hypothetical protein